MTTQLLRPRLEREHREWIQEVMAVLEPADRPEGGPWARWNALRYLQQTFPAHLEQERRLVAGIAPDLTAEQREILWALGELLDALRTHLDHLVGLCHRAEEFSATTGKILTALRHWCQAVEDSLGPLEAGSVTWPSLELLSQFGAVSPVADVQPEMAKI
jgi:hypothetical protein